MRTFTCTCGNTLYFDNNQCLNCGNILGFVSDALQLLPMQKDGTGYWRPINNPANAERHYRQCQHYATAHMCNWMVPVEEDEVFCQACRLNSVIPNLSKLENLVHWHSLERDKRRMIYGLILLGLPIRDQKQDPENGLNFRFLEDVVKFDPYSQEITAYKHIMTGHDSGTITINIGEADDSQREANRKMMNESYRTTLGHFRHEIGHYYWDQLIKHVPDKLAAFRRVFGNEQDDYQKSLQAYYKKGPDVNWPDRFISAYASAHAWEDWAETWSHYLHIIDTIESAQSGQVSIGTAQFVQPAELFLNWLRTVDFEQLMIDWQKLSTILNELNRSLGIHDAYPFQLSSMVQDKLEFVHKLVINRN